MITRPAERPKISPIQALRYLERHPVVQNSIKHDPDLRRHVDALWEYVMAGGSRRAEDQ